MIRNRVIKITLKHFPDGELGVDSLELMNYVFDLEDEFGINISEDKFSSVKTVDDVVRLMEEWANTAEDTAE